MGNRNVTHTYGNLNITMANSHFLRKICEYNSCDNQSCNLKHINLVVQNTLYYTNHRPYHKNIIFHYDILQYLMKHHFRDITHLEFMKYEKNIAEICHFKMKEKTYIQLDNIDIYNFVIEILISAKNPSYFEFNNNNNVFACDHQLLHIFFGHIINCIIKHKTLKINFLGHTNMIEHFKSYIRNICPYMFTEFKQYMMLIFRIVKNYDLYDNTLQYCQHAFHIELIQKNIYFDNNILNLC